MKRRTLSILIIGTVLLGAYTYSCIPITQERMDVPSGAIPWYEAKDYIAQKATVCGTVVDVNWVTGWPTGSTEEHTLLNIGNPYPDQDRFIVVILSHNQDNFPQPPEEYYMGKTICVTGLITDILYPNVPQAEVIDPSQIQEIQQQ